MSKQSRRTFLKKSLGAAGAVFAISDARSFGQVLGANDTIHVAVTGIHGRGGDHISEYTKMKGVQIVGLIDPDSRTFAGRIQQVTKAGGKPPKTYQDIRKALEDKDIDVISIATTNHWHTLSTIWACQAEKDVYVEKPCSHNLHEGRVAVEAARKYNRIVQHGTQGRSEPGWRQLAEIVKKGTYGNLLISRGLCYKRRDSIGFQPNGTPPPELDYNLWLGPAPEQPFNTNLVHYNWHWFWDFGNGDIGNQGVHQMDIARWMIPGARLPKSVISLGGRFGYKDQGQTPNTLITVFDFGATLLMFEVRGLPADKFQETGVGNILHFEAGIVANHKFYPKGGGKPEELPKLDGEPPTDLDHFANFIAAVRSRKTSDLHADILEGHYSSALCHLANMSYRVGQPVPFKPKTKALDQYKAADETLDRMEEHLVKNGVKLEETTLQQGRLLKVDAEKERILDDPEADRLTTRNYRAPFVVPEKLV